MEIQTRQGRRGTVILAALIGLPALYWTVTEIRTESPSGLALFGTATLAAWCLVAAVALVRRGI